MAPRRQPIKLWLDKKRIHKSGYVTPATWLIRGTDEVNGEVIKRSTKCIVDPENNIDQTAQAEEILADFLKERKVEKQPLAKAKMMDAEDVSVADVLANYLDFRITNFKPIGRYKKPVVRPQEKISMLNNLLDFFGEMTVDEIDMESCLDFTDTQVSPTAARNKLEYLRSAITVAVDTRKLKHAVKIWLPERALARGTILSTSEVALLVRTAYRKKGTAFIDGKPVRDAYIWRHLVPYILAALYTGTRKTRVVRASYVREKGRPFIDVRTGLYQRLATGEIAPTNKQAPTITLAPNLLAHMRRWKRMGRRYVVEWHGQPIKDPAKALRACIKEAFGEDTDVVPHTLRHTIASWLMSDPTLPLIDIAEYLGMTVETLVRVYGKVRKDQGNKVATAIHARLRTKLGLQDVATAGALTPGFSRPRAA